jgi:hypothetical protein
VTTASIPRHAKPPSRPASARWLDRLRIAFTRWLAHLAFAWGLARLALFLVFHPSASVPSGVLNVRVPGAPQGMRLAVLDEIAAAYRTRVAKRFGCLVAQRKFGPVVVEAHLNDDDYTAQLAARMGAGTGNEAAA